MSDHAQPEIQELRVVIQQSVVPGYARALFEDIGRASGIDLTVTFSEGIDESAGLQSVPLDGVKCRAYPVRHWRLAGMHLHWQSAQWVLATRGATDVLILEWNTRFLSLIPALLRARRQGVRTVLWGHGYSKRASLSRDCIRMISTWFADALLLYERTTAERYRASRWCRAQVFHAPNSLDDQTINKAIAACEQNPDKLTLLRQTHQLTPGNTLLFIGRLSAGNDLDFLLTALVSIVRERPACRLIIIGDDATEMPRLLERAQALQVADAVLWLGAIYQESDIAPWALISDVFVYPSNVGLSLIHAFNYGLPAVVAGDLLSHNPEIFALSHDDNGLLVPDKDPAAYARAVTDLLDDESRRQRLAAGASATVRREFNTANMVNGFLGAIRPADAGTATKKRA